MGRPEDADTVRPEEGIRLSSIKEFLSLCGVSKAYSIVDIGLLEHCIRDELNKTAPRRMAVLDPVKLVLTNYPEGKVEYFELPNNPNDEGAGMREVPFTRELYIEREDFAEVPPPKFHRLKPGGEVRLMGAYIVKYEDVVKDENGNIVEIRCTCDMETGGKNPPDGRKVKGTIHWVSAEHAVDAETRLYDYLFTQPNVFDIPEDKHYRDYVNPNSLTALKHCKLEPALANAECEERFQFVRHVYFFRDKHEGVFNRIVGLKDTYAKIANSQGDGSPG